MFQVKSQSRARKQLQTVMVISLWFHVASDWMLHNGKIRHCIRTVRDAWLISLFELSFALTLYANFPIHALKICRMVSSLSTFLQLQYYYSMKKCSSFLNKSLLEQV